MNISLVAAVFLQRGAEFSEGMKDESNYMNKSALRKSRTWHASPRRWALCASNPVNDIPFRSEGKLIMNIRLILFAGIVCATLFAISTPADAQFFSNSTGISNPAETITFSEHVLPNDTSVTNQYSDLGITFDPNNVWYNPAPSDPHTSGINPPDIGNFFPNHSASNPFFIKFNLDQTAAAFAVGINPGGTGDFFALLDGVQVASGSAPVGPVGTVTNDYYGFSGIAFDTIEVFFTNTNSQAGVIDNVQLSIVVPEPATVAVAILATLVCGIHLVRRRPLGGALAPMMAKSEI